MSFRKLWNTCLGNLFEHYDTALFSFLAPFLAPLIFPEQEKISALMLTYLLIPLGMIARPIGSLVFGFIGDVYGREKALFLTLMGMAVISGSMAFCPTFEQIGFLSPLFFCLGRILQNFLSAGETMGGAIYLLENTSEKKHDLLGSIYSASTMGGHLLASFGVFLLSHYQMIDSGWRLLYLAGCMTALFGSIARRSTSPMQPIKTTKTSLKTLFSTYRKPLLCIAIVSGFAHATYTIALVLMNGLIPLVTSISKAEIMKINSYLLIFDFSILPLFGWIASKINREKFMMAISLGAFLFAIPLMVSLEGASLITIIGIRMVFVVLGVAFYAPFHAWAQQLIPSNVRYGVISFGYAIGAQLLGSPTAAISLSCFQTTKMISSIAWYWMVLAFGATISLLFSLRVKTSEPLETV